MLAPLVPLLYLDMVTDGLLKGLDQQIRSLLYNTLDASLRVTLMAVLLPVLGLKGYFIILYACGILNVTLSLSRLLKTARVRFSLCRWILLPFLSAASCMMLWQKLPLTALPDFVEIGGALLCTGGLYVLMLQVMKKILQKRKGLFSFRSLTNACR